jgi:peptide/nickel transport system substrate-binding protein
MPREPNRSSHVIARWLTAALAAAIAGFLTAASPAVLAQEIKDGGALRAALTGEPDTLDPATSSIYTGAQVYENI